MKNKNLILVILGLLIVGSARSAAQQATEPFSNSTVANNTLYLDYTGMLLSNHLSLNYERFFTENFGVRASVGYGFKSGGENAYGVNIVPTLTLFQGSSKLEIAAGGGAISDNQNQLGVSTKFVSTGSVGYRYQPQQGGMFFRAGLSYTMKYGAPLHLSFGYTF